MIEFISTTPAHIEQLASAIRKDDLNEVRASSGTGAYEAISVCVKASAEPITALYEGDVLCIFGIAKTTFLSKSAAPWMLGSRVLDRHKKSFLIYSKRYIEEARKDYPHMVNYVDSRYIKAVRWLKWLGFDMVENAVMGYDGVMFHKFEMRTDNG